MKKLALGALCMGLLAACGGGSDSKKIMVGPDSGSGGSNGPCSPLTQAGCNTGEKCSWIIDATDPQYVGHTGCVPDGTKAVGDACTFGAAGATGYDDCKAGGVCSGFGMPGQAGKCKAVCDNNGGEPMCDATHACVTYSLLFSTGASSPAAAGVCDLSCNPLEDNDFDGPGPNTKTMNTCGSAANVGCYGYPSNGTPPTTNWSCTGDINAAGSGGGSDANLRHRSRCTMDNGCAPGGVTYINSCNQGYIPFFYEQTGSMQVTCTALCKPLDCYNGSGGNCGAGSASANQAGATPHRCKTPDIVYGVDSMAPAPLHENCQYMWYYEVDDNNQLLESPSSDTVGFCFDHSKFRLDTNGDGSADTQYPDCSQMKAVTGTGSAGDMADPSKYYGAVDFGCVSTTTAGFGSAHGKIDIGSHLATGYQVDKPRFLYHRVMGNN